MFPWLLSRKTIFVLFLCSGLVSCSVSGSAGKDSNPANVTEGSGSNQAGDGVVGGSYPAARQLFLLARFDQGVRRLQVFFPDDGLRADGHALLPVRARNEHLDLRNGVVDDGEGRVHRSGRG